MEAIPWPASWPVGQPSGGRGEERSGPPAGRYTALMKLPPVIQNLQNFQDFGFEKSRRAIAALCLGFFVTLYLLLSLNAPPGWGPAFLALAACYGVAFFGVTAEWFWGRWFASGLGWSGAMVAGLSLFMMGWMWPLVIYGALHGLVVVLLLGRRMSVLYDLQEGWRARFAMDELGVARLRKTITRTAASLPSLILWALGPKEPGQGGLLGLVVVAAALAGVAGFAAVLRLRAWGLLALGASALGLLAGFVFRVGGAAGTPGVDGILPTLGVLFAPVLGLYPGMVATVTWAGTLLPAAILLLALVPFAGPTVAFLARRPGSSDLGK